MTKEGWSVSLVRLSVSRFIGGGRFFIDLVKGVFYSGPLLKSAAKVY